MDLGILEGRGVSENIDSLSLSPRARPASKGGARPSAGASGAAKRKALFRLGRIAARARAAWPRKQVLDAAACSLSV